MQFKLYKLFFTLSYFVFAFLSFNLHAATNVSGNITGNVTWDLAGSPYTLTGNININCFTDSIDGTTYLICPSLTIESGVEVDLNGRYMTISGGTVTATDVTFTNGATNNRSDIYVRDVDFSGFLDSAGTLNLTGGSVVSGNTPGQYNGNIEISVVSVPTNTSSYVGGPNTLNVSGTTFSGSGGELHLGRTSIGSIQGSTVAWSTWLNSDDYTITGNSFINDWFGLSDDSGDVLEDRTLSIYNGISKYILTDTIDVDCSNTSGAWVCPTLTIEPGVTIDLNGNYLNVSGTMTATGVDFINTHPTGFTAYIRVLHENNSGTLNDFSGLLNLTGGSVVSGNTPGQYNGNIEISVVSVPTNTSSYVGGPNTLNVSGTTFSGSGGELHLGRTSIGSIQGSTVAWSTWLNSDDYTITGNSFINDWFGLSDDSGDVLEDRTLSIYNGISKYILTDTIDVDCSNTSGAWVCPTLTIEPGVTIDLNGNYLNVSGTMTATGVDFINTHPTGFTAYIRVLHENNSGTLNDFSGLLNLTGGSVVSGNTPGQYNGNIEISVVSVPTNTSSYVGGPNTLNVSGTTFSGSGGELHLGRTSIGSIQGSTVAWSTWLNSDDYTITGNSFINDWFGLSDDSGDVLEDRTLSIYNGISKYILTDTIDVDCSNTSGAWVCPTLTIEPGVTIDLNGNYLNVSGTMTATGVDFINTHPTGFTAYIRVLHENNSGTLNDFSGLLNLTGGSVVSGNTPGQYNGNIEISVVSVPTNTSSYVGGPNTLNVSGTTFSGSGGELHLGRTSIGSIQGSTVAWSTWLNSDDYTITGNSFINDWFGLSDDSGDVLEDRTLSIYNGISKYILTDTIDVDCSNTSGAWVCPTLTIEPGVTIDLNGNYLNVSGTMTATGVDFINTHPTGFTAYIRVLHENNSGTLNDFSGLLNLTGGSVVSGNTPGQYNGNIEISVVSVPTNTSSYVGGPNTLNVSGTTFSGSGGELYLQDTSAGFITRSLIEWSLELASTDYTIYQNTFSRATGTELEFTGTAPVNINYNNFLGDSSLFGIVNNTEFIVDATQNYWGDASGPTHSSNPSGTGSSITDDVNYGGYLIAAINPNSVFPTIQVANSKDPFAEENLFSLVADPIDVSTGAHVLKRTLAKLQGGRPIEFELNYSSLSPEDSVMGYGWYHPFQMSLAEQPDTSIEVRWPSGRLTTYTLLANGLYENVDGDAKDVLIKNTDGTFKLTDKKLNTYDFNTNGELTQQTDRKGFQLDYSYSSNQLVSVSEPISGRTLSFTYHASNKVASISSPGIGTTLFAYDANGDLISVTDAEGGVRTYTYDASHRILTEVNEIGVVFFSNTYDAEGRVITQEDGLATNLAGSLTYTPDGSGNTVTTVYSDRTGAARSYVHDSEYRLLSLTDELGHTETYTYDALGNRSSTTDADGHVTSYSYDGRGNLISLTDAQSNVTQYEYDARDNLIRAVNPAGNDTLWSYDASNRLSSETDILGHVTTHSYDSNGLRATTTRPLGGTETFVNTLGQVASITNANAETTTLAYDAAGRLQTVTNAAGLTASYSYNLLGKVLTETDPLGNVQTQVYDLRGRKTSTTDPNGNITTFSYDDNDNLIQVVDALAGVTSYQYDGEGRLTVTTDARGKATETRTYDAKGQLVTQTDALGHTYTYAYDVVGNVTSVTDPNGHVSSTMYDSLKRVTAETDGLSRSKQYAYDNLGRLTQFTELFGLITQFSHDDSGRVTGVTDAATATTSQTYDADGRRTSFTDPVSNTTSMTYDAIDQITSIQDESGASTLRGYDNRGLLVQTTNARGQVATYVYDNGGRMTSRSDPTGSISYTYDNNSNLLTVSDAVGTTTRVYDALNRITQFTDVYGNVIQYAYDAVGNLTTLTYPDSKQVNYTYDDANRLLTVTDWTNKQTAYSYDGNNNLTQMTSPNGIVTTYSYDAANQLTSLVVVNAASTELYRYDYTYDANGNVQTESNFAFVPPNVGTVAMTYGVDNKIATWETQGVAYDVDGNMTTGPLNNTLVSFTYDSRNRLLTSPNTSYVYNAEGHRVMTTQSGVATRHVVNPNAALTQVLMETDNTNTATAFYVYGYGLIGRYDASGTYRHYHYDRRGSTVALSDDTGVVTDNYYYGPFGELLQINGSTDQPYKYNGRDGVMTDGNGLYYMRARYYNPDIMRFMTKDILLGDIEIPQSLNRYAYVEGDPVYYVDPNGRILITGTALLAGAAIGATANLAFYAAEVALTDKEFSVKEAGVKAASGAVAGTVGALGAAAVAGTALAGGAAITGKAAVAFTSSTVDQVWQKSLTKGAVTEWNGEDLGDIIVTGTTSAIAGPALDDIAGKVPGRLPTKLSSKVFGKHGQRAFNKALIGNTAAKGSDYLFSK